MKHWLHGLVMTLLGLGAALGGELPLRDVAPRDVAPRDAAPMTAAQREAYRLPAAIPYPQSDPYSAAKADLGERLFNDPRLSGSQTRACVTCHNAEHAWGDGRARALGADLGPMSLRSPTLIDVAWVVRFGWDGKFRDLESVAFAPITAAGNMDLREPDLVARLAAVPDYVRRFTAAFGDPSINRLRIEQALATYERSIVAGNAPFDRWVAGDATAINATAQRGFEIFNGKGHCAECHSGFAFTDGSFHDIGTATGDDIGRGRAFPTSVKLHYAFKTPTLREVARRAPYMHDGSVPTLAAVVDLYDRGGIDRPSRAEVIRPLHLTAEEKADLVAFLNSLTNEPAAVAAPMR